VGSFYKEGELVGRLLLGPPMEFEGNARPSAKLFFDYVIRFAAEEAAQRRQEKSGRFWNLYRTSPHKWGYRACDETFEGFDSREEALEAALTSMCAKVDSFTKPERSDPATRHELGIGHVSVGCRIRSYTTRGRCAAHSAIPPRRGVCWNLVP